MRTRPLVIAHRGNFSGAPENSRPAFQQALDLGVDIIELDVNRTRDRHPVIIHGPELKKRPEPTGRSTTSRSKKRSSLTSEAGKASNSPENAS